MLDAKAAADISQNPVKQDFPLLAGHPGWLGERWFMLPNPTYGGYESAAVGNVRGLSEAQRRAAKRAALEPAR